MLHHYLHAETWLLNQLSKLEGFFREIVRQESFWHVTFAGALAIPAIVFAALPFFLAGTLSSDEAADYCFDRSLPEGSGIRQRFDDRDHPAGAGAEMFPTFFYNMASPGFSLVCFWAWFFKSPQRTAKKCANSDAALLDITCKHVLCYLALCRFCHSPYSTHLLTVTFLLLVQAEAFLRCNTSDASWWRCYPLLDIAAGPQEHPQPLLPSFSS
jgi:hypothetical protein